MSRLTPSLLTVLVGWHAALLPHPLAAQSVKATLGAMRLDRRVQAPIEAHTGGGAVGIGAALRVGRLSLDARYLQGSLRNAANPPGEVTDVVEGGARLGFAPMSWLALRLGPRVRSFVTDQGSEHWVFWEGGVRVRARLGSPALESYLEVWRTFAATVNLPAAVDNGRGFEAGLLATIPGTPLGGRLAYRLDHATLASGARVETVEMLVLALGVGR